NTNIGAGIWTFQTNTGTTEEWVAAPLEAGLNQIMIHNVLYGGHDLGRRFLGETGMISVDPSRLDIVSPEDSGAEQVDFTTYDLDLTGAAVQAYGLSKRIFETDTITTDEDWLYFMDLTDAAYLDVQTACPGQDIDLYVYWWNGSNYVMVGASETSGDEEVVRLTMPPDGEYVIDVYGYSVSGTQPFDVSISAPMGDDMVLSGIPAGGIDAGDGFTLDVDWTKVRGTLEEREGEYEGIIFIGPTEAPGAVQVPVTLRYPFEIESSAPAYNATGVALDTDVSVTFSKRVDPTTLDDTTFYLMKGMDIIPGDIEYDDLSATAVFTPDSPLLPGVNYEMVIKGVKSVDGDTLSADIPFGTEAVLDVSRIAGDDRILTAVEVSQAGFADDSVETVVIATAYNWPDALGGAALAGAVKGPILLTSPTALPAVVLTEIDRVGATSAIILGGTSAVGTPVEAALNAKLGDANVDRIGGADRYQTARSIAARVVDELGPGYDGTAFLATGANFPDALGASPLAAANGWPIYLVNPLTGADAALISAMQSDGVDDVLILGGTSAIPAAVAADVAADVPCKTTRLEGATRYETAVNVATYGVSNAGLSWDKLAIATGTNFPDALAGGVLQGKNGSVMLLTTPTALHYSVRTVLEANKLSIYTVYFLGGSNAVSDIVFDAVVGILE
ncbi:MAG TPA: cell wall-binding repeat-containing protein, partial [Coriobacteriia bacterium]|nr:cell wall-binding repeat-containing protein [Coriobacteriia bacterium]